MNRVKWKVMKAFSRLPSSPDIQAMNDVQWAYCYLNLLEDQKEEEELWKQRFNYMGWFINPKLAKQVIKYEQGLHDTPDEYDINPDNPEAPIYNNGDFETELQKAMQESQSGFMELQSNGVYGDPDMSSDEFINNMMNNIDKYKELQDKIEYDKTVKLQEKKYDDLDTFEINE